MRYVLLDKASNEVILLARLLLMVLFVLFGWDKLTDFSGTVGYMAGAGLPVPTLAAAVVVLMEFFVGLAIALGFCTRPLALLLALYTLGTALIGHHYWTMAGADRMANMVNFYKNIAIIGGLLLLCVTGPGRYSIDRR
ncbi:MAG TPA: DoxX family protein [Frateuria sp.]|uniref:DoxX family protein n=1 Tax=Frateuria sp. TaxID=2211372 RepID=UPI002DE549BC|nr:DoxX family protein [Frateuria sp.]